MRKQRATCTQQITQVDSVVPGLYCPPDITIDCDQSFGIDAAGTATGMDACGGEVSVTFNDSEQAGSCEGARVITRTWTGMDQCGNATNCIQIVTLTDMSPPIIACPADTTIECTESTSPDNTGLASGSDMCSQNILIRFFDLELPGSLCGGKNNF